MQIGLHKSISFIKSGLRIAFCLVAMGLLEWKVPEWTFSESATFILAGGLAIAEILGVLEEIKEKN